MHMLPNNNAEAVEVLTKLTQHFLKGSAKFSLNLDQIRFLTPDIQEVFLNSTIKLEIFKKYPLNNEFCKIFFKKLISYLEHEQDIHDEMYFFLCSKMGKPKENDGFCYRHYILMNNIDCIVTIKETNNMVIHGTTGMKTWEAAFMLTDWALCNSDIFQGKKVLELGSGVGFTGVAIARLCNIQSIILTDCHEEVLNTIKDNIRINFGNMPEEETPYLTTFTEKEKSLGVMMLDWNSPEDIPNEILPDIVIGADLVFDPTILLPLCKVIQTFCSKINNLEVYIASVIRNEETFKQFLEHLDKANLQYEEILLQPVCFEWVHKIKWKFLKITYKMPTELLSK